MDIDIQQGAVFESSENGPESITRNSLYNDFQLSKIKQRVNSSDSSSSREATVLLAIESAIKEIDPNLSPAAYLGLILTLINTDLGQVEGHLNDNLIIRLKLLSLILKKQNYVFLISKLDHISTILIKVLEKYYNDLKTIKLITKCISSIFEKDDLLKLSNISTLALLLTNILKLAAIRNEEEISDHISKFFNETLSKCAHNPLDSRPFVGVVSSWCNETLKLLKSKNAQVNVESNVTDYINILSFIIMLSNSLIFTNDYDHFMKSAEHTLELLQIYYSRLKSAPEKVYLIITIVQKLNTSLKVDVDDNKYFSWRANICKEIFLFLNDVIKEVNNFDLLSHSCKALTNLLAHMQSVFEYTNKNKLTLKNTDTKILDCVSSLYTDELLNVLDNMLNMYCRIIAKSGRGSSSDKMGQTIKQLCSECVLPLITACDGFCFKLKDLLAIFKKYLIATSFIFSWELIIELIPIALKNAKYPLPIKEFIHTTPLFRMALSSTPNQITFLKSKMRACFVFFTNTVGFENLFEAITSSDDTSASLKLSSYPELLYILSYSINEFHSSSTPSDMARDKVYELEKILDVFLPEIEALNKHIDENVKINNLEESVRCDRMRLRIWCTISKVCTTLCIKGPDSFKKLHEILKGVIFNNERGVFFFSKSNFRDEYIKEAYNFYSLLAMTYVKTLPLLPVEEQLELKNKYTVLVDSADKYISELCNGCIDTTVINSAHFDTLPLSAISQKLSEGKIGLTRKCTFWIAALLKDKSRIIDYLDLLLKNIINQKIIVEKKLDALGGRRNINVYLMLGLVSTLCSALSIFSEHAFKQSSEYKQTMNAVYCTVIKLLANSNHIEQKRLYGVLLVLLDEPNLLSVKDIFEDIFEKEILDSLSVGSKKIRIMIMSKLILMIPQEEEQILLEFCSKCVPEIILSTREKGSGTNKVAYSSLLSIVRHLCYTENQENTPQISSMEISYKISRFEKLLYIIFPGLALDDDMKASTAICSIYLISNFFELVPTESFINELFSTISQFSKSDNVVVLKSYLIFIRIMVSSIPQQKLDSFFDKIVSGLLEVAHKQKLKLRNITLNIFDKLARKFSYEALEGFIPPEDSGMLLAIRRRRKRANTLKAKASPYADDNTTTDLDRALTIRKSEMTNRTFKTNSRTLRTKEFNTKKSTGSNAIGDYNDLSESNDSLDTVFDLKKTSKNGGYGATLREIDGDPTNLLDMGNSGALNESVMLHTKKMDKKKKSGRKYFEENEKGKMIINEPTKEGTHSPLNDESSDSEDDFMDGISTQIPIPNKKLSAKSEKTGKRTHNTSESRKSNYRKDMKIAKTNHSWGYHDKKSTARKIAKRKKEINSMVGKKYVSKKAGGDVKRKSMRDPYAYIPLKSDIVNSINKFLKKSKKRRGKT